ncbi:hypothetical protein DFH06DRAFT_718209 [Mycena polygramma]|nr:hypothetical protein DFH06DRAFT_718209 [Mycena polygramma]
MRSKFAIWSRLLFRVEAIRAATEYLPTPTTPRSIFDINSQDFKTTVSMAPMCEAFKAVVDLNQLAVCQSGVHQAWIPSQSPRTRNKSVHVQPEYMRSDSMPIIFSSHNPCGQHVPGSHSTFSTSIIYVYIQIVALSLRSHDH